MIKHLDELVAKAKARGKRRLIVAYGQDSHTLEAVNDAIETDIINITIIGYNSIFNNISICNIKPIHIRGHIFSRKEILIV